MLQVKNICKEYKTGTLVQKALDNVSLNLRDCEFVAILGPSGSGKTTLLNIIGGLDHYDSGDVIINGVSTKKYKDRDWDSYRNHTIGFIFQSYNLIPHQSILSNVELALTISGVKKSQRRKLALKALDDVGLKDQAHKLPNQLSGGQMQRVAIARALVNNPSIILADEPTGALDTNTSIQVMNLLKNIAKDRLVVMVTHNPEPANKYATRIINLKDGKIQNDSNPYKITKKDKPYHKYMGKTSMSFLTSLSLSFNNLKTKKGRTFLTSFAGSIGIIGIALILSLSNGVNKYINSVEKETLSEYPLQIQKSGINMSSMLANGKNSANTNDNKDGEIGVKSDLNNLISTVGTNDLISFKKYLESDESKIKDYATSIEYSYNISPLIYSSNIDELRQINPDISFEKIGLGSSTNSIMSSMMNTNTFYEMPENNALYENQYDVKAGHWPTNYNELVLVLTSDGMISDYFQYALGLKDYSELDDYVSKFVKEEEIITSDDITSYSYDDILGKTFKLINASDCYEYDSTYKIWRDKTDNQEYMKNIVKNGEDLKIVGIVQPKDKMDSAMLSTGINYTSALTSHVIDESKNSKIVKSQLENLDINVFTGKSFNDDSKNINSFDINNLVQVNTNKLKSAFKIDSSKINVNFSNLNNIALNNSLPSIDINDILNKIEFNISKDDLQKFISEYLTGYSNYIKNNPDSNINKLYKLLIEYISSKEASKIINEDIEKIIKDNKSITITQEQMKQIINDILNNFEEYAKNNGVEDVTDLSKYLDEYLESDESKAIIASNIQNIIASQNLDTQISNIMNDYMKSSINGLSKSLENEINKSVINLSKSIQNAISIDTNAFTSAFTMKMTEEDLMELFSSLSNNTSDTYESNLKKLGYASLDEPDSISIYPKDFESNNEITKLLDEYNNEVKEKGETGKEISYTDMVGTLMSSVTDIVNTISYVLIAFTGISLIVSSIMIGIITYISVLERKKEIGILRTLGASKHNISEVFNAETFIIGALSGIIGIIFTLILLIPINIIIYTLTSGVTIRASLPVISAIILIILSIILTLIGGIIPSRKAAKEDPVLALRSE